MLVVRPVEFSGSILASRLVVGSNHSELNVFCQLRVDFIRQPASFREYVSDFFVNHKHFRVKAKAIVPGAFSAIKA